MTDNLAEKRFERQLAFIMELDKLKTVLRRTMLTDMSRRENSAEHSWHLTLMAVLLQENGQKIGENDGSGPLSWTPARFGTYQVAVRGTLPGAPSSTSAVSASTDASSWTSESASQSAIPCLTFPALASGVADGAVAGGVEAGAGFEASPGTGPTSTAPSGALGIFEPECQDGVEEAT